MHRRSFLQSLAALASQPAAAPKPNLLLLMVDQFRADCIAAAGNPAIHTPNLDRLARNGILFRNAWSSTPTCTPARAALLTGMSPWNHGMLGYGTVAERYPVELPRLLHNAGYFTTGIGKMHWHPQRALHGFDQTILDESGRVESVDYRSDYRSWFWSEAPDEDPDATGIDWNSYEAKPYALDERLHPTRWLGDTAVRFLRDYRRPQPFFLKVSFERPHSPYDPPQRWWDRYNNTPLPPAATGQWDDKFKPRSGKDSTIWHGDVGDSTVRAARQGYYGSVSFVDEQIGRILDALQQRGLLENTLILLLADHGDMLGDHYLWRKSYAYNGSARIPLLMHWPGHVKPGVDNHPVEIRDILPTLLDAAQAPTPQGVDGSSLLRLARDPKAAWREWIDLEHDVCYSPENHWNALTDGRRKYIFHAQRGEEQFFNLEADPAERADLSAQSPEVALWRDRMVAHLAVRGENWVKDGRLVARPKGQPYSPHYPGKA